MGTEKRERQKAGRAARVEAAEAAKKQAENRRRIAWIVGTVAFVAVVLLVLSLVRGNDKKNDTASSLELEHLAPRPPPRPSRSAAGKPCVALADPLPAGAPERARRPGPAPDRAPDDRPGRGHRRPGSGRRDGDGRLHRCVVLDRQDLRLVVLARRAGHVPVRAGHPGLDQRHPRHEGRRSAPAR